MNYYIENGYIKRTEPEASLEGYFDNTDGTYKLYLQMLLTLIIYLTGAGSYVFISNEISLEDSVEDGIGVLNKVSTAGWICFCIFWTSIFVYYFKEIINNLGAFVGVLKFVFIEHLKIDADLETVYNTPKYYHNEQELNTIAVDKPKNINNNKETNENTNNGHNDNDGGEDNSVNDNIDQMLDEVEVSKD